MNNALKVGRFQTVMRYSDFDLITIRTGCLIGLHQLELALELAIEKNPALDESQRKKTTDLILNLRHAVIALSDLEAERNIATHNAMMEKTAHTQTIAKLTEANSRIQSLELEGQRLRANIEKLIIK